MKRKLIQFGIFSSFVAFLLYWIKELSWFNFYIPADNLPSFWSIFGVLYSMVILGVVVLLLLEHNRPTKTLAWLLVILFIPVLGLVLYLFFGFNYRKEKLFDDKKVKKKLRIDAVRKAQLKDFNDEAQDIVPETEDKAFIQNNIKLLLNNSRTVYSRRNKMEILPGGDEKLAALLKDLDEARQFIHLEYYIIKNGRFSEAIKGKLVQQAQKGVEVRVLYDDVGSWNLNPDFRNSIQAVGGELAAFMPVRFPLFTSRFNYRNHRKMMIVDGEIAYTGGININDKYLAGKERKWRDTHLRLEGEVVKSLATIFMLDWHFATGKWLDAAFYFPPTKIEADTLLQVVASGPDTPYPGIMHAYFNAICTAKSFVYIATPYFVPNQSILTALKTTALSGVDIRLLIPAEGDSRVVTLTGQSYFEELMEAGVRIYRYLPAFIHCKVMIADEIFGSVGTANMDIRSFETNFEVNTVIYDKKMNAELKRQYLADLEESEEVDLAVFKDRTTRIKLAEGIARLLSPLL